MIKKVTNTIYYIGVNDHKIDLFEGQYQVLNGISYNSYLIEDEKIAIMDTVDENFSLEWLKNIEDVLNGKLPSYLIVSHMEPDHSASINECLKKYPKINTRYASIDDLSKYLMPILANKQKKCKLSKWIESDYAKKVGRYKKDSKGKYYKLK